MVRLLEVIKRKYVHNAGSLNFFYKMSTVLKGRAVYNFLFLNSARIISRSALRGYSTEVGNDVQSQNKELKVVYDVEDVSHLMPFGRLLKYVDENDFRIVLKRLK